MAVGLKSYPDGNIPSEPRYGRTNEAIVQQANGKYYELASRGLLFAAADQGAGVAVQTSIGTTGNLSLHNPVGSGKRLVVCKVSAAYFSGTLTAGAFYHGYNPVNTTLPTSGTSLTAVATGIGTSGAAAVGVALTGATVVAGKVLWPFASNLPILASSANDPFTLIEDLDGEITIDPGAVYQLLSVMGGTGSTPKMSFGIVWAEIPLSQSSC